MANPTAAILIIGDEILSGRTRDANIHFLAGELTRIGIDLQEVRVISDRHAAIVSAVNQLRTSYDTLFTSGGIGPTHDDITADAIAAAFGMDLRVRPDARALLQAHYDRAGLELNEARLRMARIPTGATLIDNPISTAPGFSLGNVHVMAGVPNIFQAMVASLLPRLTGGAPILSQTLRVMSGEGTISAPLSALAGQMPDLSFGSYPFVIDGAYGTNLVVRGPDAARLDQAMAQMRQLFAKGTA